MFGEEKCLLALHGIEPRFLGCVSESLYRLSVVVYNKIKVKVKFSLEQAVKAQRGSRGTAVLFL